MMNAGVRADGQSNPTSHEMPDAAKMPTITVSTELMKKRITSPVA
jgi:hypothetical protein